MFDKLKERIIEIGNTYNKKNLNDIGQKLVDAVVPNTPVKTGKTASSWFYEIENVSKNKKRVILGNSNVVNHVNIAMLIDKGHMTKRSKKGRWIAGYNYIHPSIDPVIKEELNPKKIIYVKSKIKTGGK